MIPASSSRLFILVSSSLSLLLLIQPLSLTMIILTTTTHEAMGKTDLLVATSTSFSSAMSNWCLPKYFCGTSKGGGGGGGIVARRVLRHKRKTKDDASIIDDEDETPSLTASVRKAINSVFTGSASNVKKLFSFWKSHRDDDHDQPKAEERIGNTNNNEDVDTEAMEFLRKMQLALNIGKAENVTGPLIEEICAAAFPECPYTVEKMIRMMSGFQGEEQFKQSLLKEWNLESDEEGTMSEEQPEPESVKDFGQQRTNKPGNIETREYPKKNIYKKNKPRNKERKNDDNESEENDSADYLYYGLKKVSSSEEVEESKETAEVFERPENSPRNNKEASSIGRVKGNSLKRKSSQAFDYSKSHIEKKPSASRPRNTKKKPDMIKANRILEYGSLDFMNKEDLKLDTTNTPQRRSKPTTGTFSDSNNEDEQEPEEEESLKDGLNSHITKFLKQSGITENPLKESLQKHVKAFLRKPPAIAVLIPPQRKKVNGAGDSLADNLQSHIYSILSQQPSVMYY